MKSTLSRLALGVVFAISPFALAVEEDEDLGEPYTLQEVHVKAIEQLPVPYHTPVINGIRREMVGTEIKLSFRVDEKGRPREVDTVIPMGGFYDNKKRDLACLLIRSVENWKFNPALGLDNRPTAVQVVLPVRIVKDKSSGKAYAQMSLQLDMSKGDRS